MAVKKKLLAVGEWIEKDDRPYGLRENRDPGTGLGLDCFDAVTSEIVWKTLYKQPPSSRSSDRTITQCEGQLIFIINGDVFERRPEGSPK